MRPLDADPLEAAPLDVLAIAAHPDDIEQTCGGTLIRLAETGYRTGALDLTAGEMGTRGTPALRLEESEAAGRRMLLTWRGNLCLPDAALENTLEARRMLAGRIRSLRPRLVMLPYWEARHPDHYNASRLGYEACYLAGLKRFDPDTPPHRPSKIIYASLYADVKPSFISDITGQFERRMQALFCYQSQYGARPEAGELFPSPEEIRQRLEAVARFYGHQVGVRYGEPFVVKEAMRIDDPVTMGVRSL